MRKILCLFSALVLYSCFSNAQNPNTKILSDLLIESDAVFEGRVEKVDTCFRQRDKFKTCHIIKLEKVFKGNLQKGTVEIISDQPSFYIKKDSLVFSPIIEYSHGMGVMSHQFFQKGKTLTFFVKKAEKIPNYKIRIIKALRF